MLLLLQNLFDCSGNLVPKTTANQESFNEIAIVVTSNTATYLRYVLEHAKH